MKKHTFFFTIAILITLCSFQNAGTRAIHSEQFKFTISLPGQMQAVNDSFTSGQASMYYDTVTQILMQISARDAKYNSVDDYLNCTNERLEELLRQEYGDPTLKVLRCIKSPYYPKEITVLNFQVSILPMGYNANIIYFIHHAGKDLQIAFTYKTTDQNSLLQIDDIMKTLKLE